MPVVLVNGNPETAEIWDPLCAELDRTDVLRRTGGRLRVARRAILLDQNILQAKNISTFF